MKDYHTILSFLVACSCCFFTEKVFSNEKNTENWEFLSINAQNLSEVESLNKDIMVTVITGKPPARSKAVDRELSLQKETELYREILDRASRNKEDHTTAFTKDNLQNGLNLSCFVAGVFLPEMAIALKDGNTSFVAERLDQILHILPVTDMGYSFVISPLFALIPQGAYYSNISGDIATDSINMVDRLLEKCRSVIENNKNIPAGKLFFIKKNIVSLETLRMNLSLMKFYQKNRRWPAEKEVRKSSILFAETVDYHEADGSFSYQLFFPALKMKSEASVMPLEKNQEIIIKRIKDWVPLKITPLED